MCKVLSIIISIMFIFNNNLIANSVEVVDDVDEEVVLEELIVVEEVDDDSTDNQLVEEINELDDSTDNQLVEEVNELDDSTDNQLVDDEIIEIEEALNVDGSITQATADEDGIHLFTNLDITSEENVLIVGQSIVDKSTLEITENEEITENIIFLIDLSTSVKSAQQTNIKNIVTEFAENKNDNQKIMIVGFGIIVEVLCDSTADKDEILLVLESLTYDKLGSNINDALNYTLNIVETFDANSLNNIILVTDGIEYTSTGITQNELYLYVQKCGYKIDTIALYKDNNSTALRELFAISRLTNGIGYSTGEDTESEIANMLISKNQDVDYYKIPLSNLWADGSEKTLTIKTDTNSYIKDIRIPTVILEELELILIEEEIDLIEDVIVEDEILEDSTENTESVIETLDEFNVADENDSNMDFGNIIIILLIIVSILIIGTMLVVEKRKKEDAEIEQIGNIGFVKTNKFDRDVTEISSNNMDLDVTQLTSENYDVTQLTSQDAYLYQKGNESVTVPVGDEVTIGRGDDCDIVISNETSMSRVQCKIYLLRDEYFIENLSSSNKTKLNNNTIENPIKLNDNDVITMGRVEMVFKN